MDGFFDITLVSIKSSRVIQWINYAQFGIRYGSVSPPLFCWLPFALMTSCMCVRTQTFLLYLPLRNARLTLSVGFPEHTSWCSSADSCKTAGIVDPVRGSLCNVNVCFSRCWLSNKLSISYYLMPAMLLEFPATGSTVP